VSQTTPCPNEECGNGLTEDTCTFVDAYLAMGDLCAVVVCSGCGHEIEVSGDMTAHFSKTELEADS
jgi:hypothetical protein